MIVQRMHVAYILIIRHHFHLAYNGLVYYVGCVRIRIIQNYYSTAVNPYNSDPSHRIHKENIVNSGNTLRHNEILFTRKVYNFSLF